MKWKPPKTKAGKPCKRCKPGAWCPSHRQDRVVKAAKSGRKRGSYNLTRHVVDGIRDAIHGGTLLERDLWTIANVSSSTFLAWKDQGCKDHDEGRVTIYREFYEVLRYGRRALARDLYGTAVAAARGVQVQGRDGVFGTPPDGRLALTLAERLDPEEFRAPVDRHEVEHSGKLAGEIRVVSWTPSPKDMEQAEHDDQT